MKKLIVMAIALGFSVSAFAQFGSYDPSVYEAEEAAAAYQAQQNQMALYYQNLAYQNNLAMQEKNNALIAEDLKDGKPDTDLAKLYMESLKKSNTPQVDNTEIYDDAYEATVASYRHKFAIDNQELYQPYFRKAAKIEGQMMLDDMNAAQRQNTLKNRQQNEAVYAEYIAAKCRNSNTLSPAEMMLCGQQYLKDDAHARGRTRYQREKVLNRWFNISE